MDEILSQAEIEALLASLTGEGEPAEATEGAMAPSPVAAVEARPAGKADGRAIAYEVYDFRRPDKLSKDQMRTLQMLHETFARLLASSLTTHLRVSAHVDLVSVEQIPYDEYTRSLTSSIINVFSIPPLAGQALLEIEFSVVLSMIDRRLGGPGNMVKSNLVLTEIEQALTESIVTQALKDLKAAWEGVAKFNPRHERMETQAQFIQIVPPNDVVVSILFEVKVGDLRGAMSLCIPYMLLKPISSKLSAQRWFSSTVKGGISKDAQAVIRQLQTTHVTCVCRLGNASMSVRELLNLRVGDTVPLGRRCTEEVDLLLGDRVKFRGKPGRAGRKVALHINRTASDDDAADRA
ncbi:MAG: flagellar motor switch protein FliM [Chthonomonadales bacterium]|nr:flagellar motor switch protein FliM [Chthonomonadales bacterium]